MAGDTRFDALKTDQRETAQLRQEEIDFLCGPKGILLYNETGSPEAEARLTCAPADQDNDQSRMVLDRVVEGQNRVVDIYLLLKTGKKGSYGQAGTVAHFKAVLGGDEEIRTYPEGHQLKGKDVGGKTAIKNWAVCYADSTAGRGECEEDSPLATYAARLQKWSKRYLNLAAFFEKFPFAERPEAPDKAAADKAAADKAAADKAAADKAAADKAAEAVYTTLELAPGAAAVIEVPVAENAIDFLHIVTAAGKTPEVEIRLGEKVLLKKLVVQTDDVAHPPLDTTLSVSTAPINEATKGLAVGAEQELTATVYVNGKKDRDIKFKVKGKAAVAAPEVKKPTITATFSITPRVAQGSAVIQPDVNISVTDGDKDRAIVTYRILAGDEVRPATASAQPEPAYMYMDEAGLKAAVSKLKVTRGLEATVQVEARIELAGATTVTLNASFVLFKRRSDGDGDKKPRPRKRAGSQG